MKTTKKACNLVPCLYIVHYMICVCGGAHINIFSPNPLATALHAHTQITWTWLCTRGKKLYKYCSFSHTNRSFRVLGCKVSLLGFC